ncbi:hypothetical protein KFE25_007295 [Diacronema lutheri]|uniref:Protein kinase domain-containing protein n=1 Tax=Diacronema lutheri TaxID=2081491 RepID=A0A8J5XUK4_DIALT|nr:hypothetical protein KFE25_007295 [Diacronema lutheri]
MSRPVPVPGREQIMGAATGRTLEEHYELLEVLGRGSFSVVHRARHRQTGEVFACKVIDKWSIHNRQRLANEIEVLQRVSHPSVIRLHDIFETDRVLALVTDIAAGGELFDKIVDKGHYSEKEASEVVRCLLSAIGHLHSHGIVHRDIKPENILLARPGSDVDVKLSDFGLAKIFSGDEAGTPGALGASADDGALGAAAGSCGGNAAAFGGGAYGRARAFTVCGTDYYVAPEVLRQAGYTHACDLWSLGVVLYILLSGCPPFYEGNEEGISVQRKIVSGSYSFPDRYWSEVSAEAKDLVSRLLQVDPAQRYTVQQSLAHPWVTRQGVSSGSLPRQNAELFRTFNNKRKNSVAGSPLVGSYSLFGSLQSPADSSFHMPGKHKRIAPGPPAAQLPAHAAVGLPPQPAHTAAGAPGGGCACGNGGWCGCACGNGGWCGCADGAAAGGKACGGGGGGLAAGGLSAAAARPPPPPPHARDDPGAAHAASACEGGRAGGGHARDVAPFSATATVGGGVPIPGSGSGGGGGGARGVPIPHAAHCGNPHLGGHPHLNSLCAHGAADLSGAGSLSASPPVGLLSASPNPGGAAFLMEI